MQRKKREGWVEQMSGEREDRGGEDKAFTLCVCTVYSDHEIEGKC